MHPPKQGYLAVISACPQGSSRVLAVCVVDAAAAVWLYQGVKVDCKHHSLVVGQILVAGKDIALELLEVVVPEFGSVAVEGTCAVLMVSLDG